MFKALQRKLVFICTGITGLILVWLSLTSLYAAQGQLEENGRTSFSNYVNSVLFHLESQNIIDHTWLSQVETEGGFRLYIFLNGKPLIYNGSGDREERESLLKLARAEAEEEYGFDGTAPPESELVPDPSRFRIRNEQGEEYYAACAKIPMEKGFLSLFLIKSRREERAELLQQRRTFFLLSAVSLCLLFLFAWFFTARLLRPIEENRRRQMEFVSAASHELRSPMAVIRAGLSAVKETSQEQERRHFLEMADMECSRMSALIDDLLFLANADEGSWSVAKEETEVEGLLLTVFENFQRRAFDKKISLTVSLPEEPLPHIYCDGFRIEQVLAVLLDNAIAYTPSGGKISLFARSGREKTVFGVSDNGPGIPADKKPFIFDRFYRADPARSKRNHYGLGLSIAKEIVLLHNGTITAEASEEGGALFLVTLPAVFNDKRKHRGKITHRRERV